MAIDPTARVADGARVGDGVEIGPYCMVGPDVQLGDGVRLIAHVHIAGVTTIGEGTVVYPFASLGTPPQSVHYRGGATRLIVGPRCELRESVTMNTGTEDGGGVTRVGERGLLMVGSHVGHDCQIGDQVTFANNVTLGGHVTIGDGVFVGGLAAVHQFGRVGEGAMIGGMSPIRADVIPFTMAYREDLVGLNVVGLRRRGITHPQMLRLRRAYRQLFFGAGTFADRVEGVAREFSDEPRVGRIIAFIREGRKRPLMRPAGQNGGEEAEHDFA
jgi:UDP-N-acetylglucosamine acyltransferase